MADFQHFFSYLCIANVKSRPSGNAHLTYPEAAADSPFVGFFARFQKLFFMKRYWNKTNFARIITPLILLLLSLTPAAATVATPSADMMTTTTTTTAADGDGMDWRPLIDAIAHFESRGNARAVNGQYVGLLQISPALVKECNSILKRRGSSKRYTLKDRYNAEKSREMFAIIQSHHNPTNSIDRAIRIWKGGIGYSIKRTQGYVNRILKHMGL